MTRHYTHIGEAAATTAVAALPDITGEIESSPPARGSVELPVTNLREIAEKLTASNVAEVRAQLFDLVRSASPSG